MRPLLHGQPAVKILIPFIAGLLCAFFLPIPWPWAAAALAILLLPALAAHHWQRHRLFAVIATAAFFCAGSLRFALNLQLIPPDDMRRMADWPDPLTLEGTIAAPVELRDGRQIFALKVDSLWTEERGFAVRGRCRVVLYDTLLRLRQGDRIAAKGMLRRPTGAHNPGDFDFRAWLAGQKIYTQLSVSATARVLLLARDQDPPPIRWIVRPLREHILRTVASSLQGQEGALLSALLIGVRSEIDDELRDQFSRVGVVHVLAVSGLHVGFILAALHFLIRLLRLPFQTRLPLLLVLLWLYVLITGSAPPVLRAAITATLLLAAPLFERRFNPVNAIALAALLLLIINPHDLLAPGFQLSFAAALGILLIYGRLNRWAAAQIPHWQRQERRWFRAALQLLMVSLAAQIATLPLTVWYFNIVPVYGLLANLAVVPLVSLITIIGFAAVLIALPAPLMGGLLLQAAGALLKLLIAIVTRAAALPGAALEVPRPSLLLLALFYLLLAVLLSWPRRRAAFAGMVMLLLTANLWIWPQALRRTRPLQLLFFDVGQGDAALIAFPNGFRVLIDGGDANERFDVGRQTLLPWLRRSGIRRLDAAFVTHSHSDHAGGIASLLAAGRIGRLYHPGGEAAPAFAALDSTAVHSGVPVHRAAAGAELFPAAGGWLRILHPAGLPGEPWDENNGSMVVRLQYGRCVFLFLADLEVEGERQLLAYGGHLHAEVVKVAHHGSQTASSAELVAATAPRYAVMSVGRANRFSFPAPEVVARWQLAGARVLRTDLEGALLFNCDGDSLRLQTPIGATLTTNL